MRSLSCTALRAHARTPPAPCSIGLEGGDELAITSWLRILPGKRLTGVARWRGQTVLAKLFIASTGAARHCERECRGAELLAQAGLPTPALRAHGLCAEGGAFILFDYLYDARPVAPEQAAQVTAAFTLLGRLHANGLIQADAHFGNFLVWRDQLVLVDGDAVRPGHAAREYLDNLALLCAQLPSADLARYRRDWLTAYRHSAPDPIDEAALDTALNRARQVRLDEAIDKSLRDCTQFAVTRSWRRFTAVPRALLDELAPLVADPDAWLRQGETLKSGHTATVACVTHAGRQYVIKRYNIKNALHWLSRFWRPSRAWHSWREGHRLRLLGIATPRPLALIEERLGPWRGKAWLITELCPGELFSEVFTAPPDTLALDAIRRLFAQLEEARISHGDFKAKNLLWRDGTPVLIDLDAMRQHRDEATFRRDWAKDRARFLKNWPEGSPIWRAMEAAFPPG